MNSALLRIPLLIAAFVIQHSSFVIAQGGSLTPPGAPAPTMKSLDEIDAKLEKRTPVSALPATITASGSYYVTSNLTGTAGQHGITIDANDVTLDLGGFTLVGPTTGTATHAVRIVAGRSNVIVRDGIVRNWVGGGIISESDTSKRIVVEDISIFSPDAVGIDLGNTSIARNCMVELSGSTGISAGVTCQIVDCSVVNIGGAGILTSNNCTLSNCTAFVTGLTGMSVGNGSIVTGCTVAQSSGSGFSIGAQSTVRNSAARENTGTGISVGTGSAVADCTAESNLGSAGISAGFGCTISGCVARANTSSSNISSGITVSGESTVTRCTVTNTATTAATLTNTTGMGINVGAACTVEACTVQGSAGDGIRASSSCLIIANNCEGNGSFASGDGAGIHTTGGENRIEGNTVTGADRGIDVDGTGNFIIKNSARNNTTNYSIAASNRYGPVIDITATGTAAVSGNSAADTSGSTHPWANFAH